MKINKKNVLNLTIYAFLFIISFIIFVYFTFPYQVLKESISAQVFKYSGVHLRIENLSPSFPLGINLNKVQINKGLDFQGLYFPKINLKISLFSLLLGHLNLYVKIIEESRGTLLFQIRYSLWSILSGNLSLPSKFIISSKKFNLEKFIDFSLNTLSKQANINPLLGPFLSQIHVKGALDGSGEFYLNSSNISKSYGYIDLKLVDARILISDKSLNIAEQKLNKAGFKADLKNGVFKIYDTSGLQSSELGINLKGEINLQQQFFNSTVNIDINLWLDGELKNQFGFIIDAVTGNIGARANFKLTGTLFQIRPVM